MNTQPAGQDKHRIGEISQQRKNPALQSGALRGAKRISKGPENERLKNACADFEGILLNFVFQNMKKTLPGDGVFPKSHQSDVYESMFFQEISSKLARERGIGIGDALYRQVRGQISEDRK